MIPTHRLPLWNVHGSQRSSESKPYHHHHRHLPSPLPSFSHAPRHRFMDITIISHFKYQLHEQFLLHRATHSAKLMEGYTKAVVASGSFIFFNSENPSDLHSNSVVRMHPFNPSLSAQACEFLGFNPRMHLHMGTSKLSLDIVEVIIDFGQLKLTHFIECTLQVINGLVQHLIADFQGLGRFRILLHLMQCGRFLQSVSKVSLGCLESDLDKVPRLGGVVRGLCWS